MLHATSSRLLLDCGALWQIALGNSWIRFLIILLLREEDFTVKWRKLHGHNKTVCDKEKTDYTNYDLFMPEEEEREVKTVPIWFCYLWNVSTVSESYGVLHWIGFLSRLSECIKSSDWFWSHTSSRRNILIFELSKFAAKFGKNQIFKNHCSLLTESCSSFKSNQK